MSLSNTAIDFDFQFPVKPKLLNSHEKAQYIEKIKEVIGDAKDYKKNTNY